MIQGDLAIAERLPIRYLPGGQDALARVRRAGYFGCGSFAVHLQSRGACCRRSGADYTQFAL